MRRLTYALLLFSLAVVGFTPSLSTAGAIGPGDFPPLDTQTTTFDGLGLPDPFATPYSIDGLTITSDTGALRYRNFSACLGGFSSDCIATNSLLGWIDVTFDTPVVKAGAYASGFNTIPTQGWAIEVQFFDPSDQLLGDVDLLGLGPPPAFAGWEDAGGIGRMRFSDLTPDAFIMALDQVMVVIPPPNDPPDCSGAEADPDSLWPPDHRLEAVSIEGVIDPDGDPVTVSVTGISQDEPLNGLGDGDTSPDGFGIGTDAPEVRVERQGVGDGRVYHITFEADDGQGGACDGTVTVCVPHDEMPGDDCVDQGPLFDSTGEDEVRNAVAMAMWSGECGLGPELVLLLPPLLWLRGRRRRT